MWKWMIVMLVATPAFAQVSVSEAQRRLRDKEAARHAATQPTAPTPAATTSPPDQILFLQTEVTALKAALATKDDEIARLKDAADKAEALAAERDRLAQDKAGLKARVAELDAMPKPVEGGARVRYGLEDLKPDQWITIGGGVSMANIVLRQDAGVLSVMGEIGNHTDRNFGQFQAQVNLYDARGKIVGQASILVESLGPGQAKGFSAPAFNVDRLDVDKYSVQLSSRPQASRGGISP